ncbi:zinc phosphodiesterase ELAC protein 1-like isoform X4 [Zootermopsis nevadensis]|uniref:zinc phosphodiesterase ELAC protein 1-like isoform X4 n=1 Tax=Zootermopsis nevadensis TaxID=136037 RepID=UPI000B8E2DFE|nr:zinc phosphodiesterase ELAC protein 1-like isoform X4 [Zootermopsis nevadensis]
MKIICLGTASCYPTSNRSVSCTAVRFEDGTVWIFDCGEGAQIQLQKSPVRPSRITKIFITHLHGDHVHELIPIAEQYPEDWNTWPADNLATGSLHPQEKQGKDITATNDLTWNVFDGQNVCVKAGALMHSIPSFGYVIAEQDEPGKLDAEYLKQLGVPPGPLYSRIKNGEAITLPSGKALDPLKVLGPPKRGRKITILGDTSDSFRMVDLAQSSDIILHEATLENSMEEKAIDMGHSTPKMAAQYAEKVGARVLMLYHFSQRYKTVLVNDTDLCVDTLLKEAQHELSTRNCPCKVFLAQDLMEVSVPRPSS